MSGGNLQSISVEAPNQIQIKSVEVSTSLVEVSTCTVDVLPVLRIVLQWKYLPIELQLEYLPLLHLVVQWEYLPPGVQLEYLPKYRWFVCTPSPVPSLPPPLEEYSETHR